MILVPTQSMVADALTKPMVSKQLLHLLSTGCVEFRNENGHPLEPGDCLLQLTSTKMTWRLATRSGLET